MTYSAQIASEEVVSSKLALTIGAVAAVVFGLALALLPEQMLAGFGLGVPKEAQVLSDVGVTLIGLGIINWLARNEMGPAVRAAGGLVLHLVLAVIFLLPLRRNA